MFDIGFSELRVIAVVALIVLGPERLPRAARFAGLWVRRARAQWYAVKAELERDLAAEELRRSLQQTGQDLRATGQQLEQDAQALRDAASIRPDALPPDPRPDAPAEPPHPPAARDDHDGR